ncbi:MAG: hypothetical protein ABIQ11_11235, partial [Saprospiraceae bacterium]
GYKSQSFGIYLSGNTRTISQPRQYLIDNYKNSQGSIDVPSGDPDNTFTDKPSPALGVTVIFFIGS